MSYRDPAPETPPCPACDSTEQVRSHDNHYQGRWLAHCCMVLFDGASAEFVGPAERQRITDEVDTARAALKKGLGVE